LTPIYGEPDGDEQLVDPAPFAQRRIAAEAVDRQRYRAGNEAAAGVTDSHVLLESAGGESSPKIRRA